MHPLPPGRWLVASLVTATVIAGLPASRTAASPGGSGHAIVDLVRQPADYEVDPPVRWTPSETKRYPVVVANTGTRTWRAEGDRSVRLSVSFGGPDDDPDIGRVTDQRAELPRDVAPGETVAVDVAVTAPTRPGRYVLRHQLVLDDTGWFEALARTEVRVDQGWAALAALAAAVLVALGGAVWYVARSTRRNAA